MLQFVVVGSKNIILSCRLVRGGLCVYKFALDTRISTSGWKQHFHFCLLLHIHTSTLILSFSPAVLNPGSQSQGNSSNYRLSPFPQVTWRFFSPGDLFKYGLERWILILGKLFNYIHFTSLSSVIPAFKRDKQNLPTTYILISLFDITAKLCSKHVLHKLEDWVIDNRLLDKEQARLHLG